MTVFSRWMGWGAAVVLGLGCGNQIEDEPQQTDSSLIPFPTVEITPPRAPVAAPDEPAVEVPEPPVEEVPEPLPPGDPFDFVIAGSADKVRPGVYEEGPTAVSLVAARNEFESFQVVVRAPVAALSQVTVAMRGDLVGPGGATVPLSNMTVYRVGYLPVKIASDREGAPGRWPDPLIPTVDTLVGEKRNAFPVDVPVGENRVAWVDVLVPRDAVPGVYRGSVEVSGDGHFSRIPVTLKVLNFTLPSTPRLKSSFGLNETSGCAALGYEDCDSKDRAKLLEARNRARALFVRSALDNRITIASAHTANLNDDRAEASFKKYAVPFIEGTAQTRLAGARMTTYQTVRLNYSGLDSDQPELPSEERRWVRVAREVGLGLDRLFAYVCDEPHFFPVYGEDAANWKLCKAKIEQTAIYWPEIPKLVTAHIQSSDPAGTTSLLDIMVINVELLEGPLVTPWFPGNQRPLYDAFRMDTSRPKQLWLYAACGSHGCVHNDRLYNNGWAGYEVDAPASEQRAMAWLAYRYDLDGTLYFDTVLKLSTAWEDVYSSTGNGDGTLFYPGTPDRIGGATAIPIESIRLKAARDGYEDYEYLVYLNQNGKGTEARAIARALFPVPYQTAQTDAAVQAAHLQLAELVQGVAAAAAPAP